MKALEGCLAKRLLVNYICELVIYFTAENFCRESEIEGPETKEKEENVYNSTSLINFEKENIQDGFSVTAID